MVVSRKISKKANKMWTWRQLFRQHMQHVYEQFCDAVVGDDHKGKGHEHHVCVAPGAKDHMSLVLLL